LVIAPPEEELFPRTVSCWMIRAIVKTGRDKCIVSRFSHHCNRCFSKFAKIADNSDSR